MGTRRTVGKCVLSFLCIMAFGFTTLGGWSAANAAQKPKRNYILIGIVNPTTGMIAGFGEPTPLVDYKAIAAVNKKGGIYIAKYGKKLPVKFIVMDSESSAAKAAQAATKLILEKKVDLLIGQYTPLTVNPVAAVAERYKMPCVTVGDPDEEFVAGGHHHWSFNACFAIRDLVKTYVEILNKMPTNKKVGVMFGTQDGAVIRPYMEKAVRAAGYTIVDPGLIPVGTKDFSSVIEKFRHAHCDIVIGIMPPPDFATAWKQYHQAGYLPKIMTMGKAILFPTNVQALGDDLGVGLTSEMWWGSVYPFKSSLDGTTAQQLCDWWIKKTGKEPTAALGMSYSIMEIAINALERAKSLNRNKLREAIESTNLVTLMGPIRFNKQNYAATPVAGSQWVKGKRWSYVRVVLVNGEAPGVPISKQAMIPIPGSK